MGTVESYKEEKIVVDAEGNETVTTIEKTRKRERSTEPSFIKLYTDMWCQYNGIPSAYHSLFLELATRMSYTDKEHLEQSQTVCTYGYMGRSICERLGWTSRDSLTKGIKALCQCGAIRRVGTATYQINPSYAGKGPWKYDPRLKQGGIEDIVAIFNFADKSVDTHIIWATDGKDPEMDKMYRQATGTAKTDSLVITETTKTKASPAATPASKPVDVEIDDDFTG